MTHTHLYTHTHARPRMQSETATNSYIDIWEISKWTRCSYSLNFNFLVHVNGCSLVEKFDITNFIYTWNVFMKVKLKLVKANLFPASWDMLRTLWCCSTSFGWYILFEVFAFRPWIEMEDPMALMASAPLLALRSFPTKTGQAEMTPASILICIYPADDPLLSVCHWRHKLHPS